MISALCWVPKGVSASLPSIYEPTEEQLQEWAEEEGVIEVEEEEEEEELVEEEDIIEKEELEELEKEAIEIDGEINKKEKEKKEGGVDVMFNMSAYDGEGGGVFDVGEVAFDDPMTQEMIAAAEEDDLYDVTIKGTDAILLTAVAEEDMSSLLVRIYEEEHKNMYVHHEVYMSAFVLCMEHINAPLAAGKNLVAIGSFDPKIEIWNIDVLDALEPVISLGFSDVESIEDLEQINLDHLTSAQRKRVRQRLKKKREKQAKLQAGGHKDAVMGLSWNKHKNTILASGSADQTVKLWDLTKAECLQTYSHHKDNVQSVEWNPTEPQILLTGSYDKTVRVFDIRTPEKMGIWNVTSDVECLHWDPHNPDSFLVSCEDGSITCCSVREPGKPLWTIKAHDKAASCLSLNTNIPGFVASASMDKTLKLWDIRDGSPKMLYSNNVGLGKIFSLQFFGSSPYLLAGGGKKQVRIWHTNEISAVHSAFPSK